MTTLSHAALTDALACGLLGFPLTDFGADGAFSAQPFGDRVRRMTGQGAAALFAAGGAGEFFSLARDEYRAVMETAVAACGHRLPLLGAAGGATCDAIDHCAIAEKAGADGVLLLPPYLAEASQAGLFAHVAEICRSTSLAVVLYGRANGRPSPDTLMRLAEACPNLIAYKDGVGAIEDLWAMRAALGGRLAFLNGMPTAEVYAPAYRAMGVPTYSSAVYNFAPGAAMRFFAAVQGDELSTIDAMMRAFFIPYGRLRARQPGYAVSIVKAGVARAGHGAGAVRPPLSELTEEELRELDRLLDALSAFEETPHARAV